MIRNAIFACTLAATLTAGQVRAATQQESSSSPSISSFQQIIDQGSEEEAYAIGVEAYLYGYPRVEMARRIHNETNRVSADQLIYAPPNEYFHFGRLARPGDGKVIKAPNNDTLYASAYLDLTDGPVLLSIPPMGNRLYVALLVDAAGRVVDRLSSTVKGPGNQTYGFIGPNPKNALPAGVKPIPVGGNDLWMLMRVATDGTAADAKVADGLLRQFKLSRPGAASETRSQPEVIEPLEPLGSFKFFHEMARMLERNPVPAEDVGMLKRWERIGIANGRFDEQGLSPAVRKGLTRSIQKAESIITAAQFGIAITRNGWNYSLKVGRTGNDWALNAAIARGGFGNLPEDSVYYQRNLDAKGVQLSGSAGNYLLTFPKGSLPPVNSFWSVTAYDMATFDLIENPIKRYSIGDRTKGLITNPDGSLTIAIQNKAPTNKVRRANWLPVADKPFYLIIRAYDPYPEMIDGRWAPPELVSEAR